MIELLDATIQNYAWGSRTAIPKLVGAPPDGRPQAELWIGAHPKAPSRLGGQPLDRAIAADPLSILGRRVAERFGELPFLLKVLAAATPLSIQCHPDRRQAAEGFARENAAGIPLDAPHRNYRDPNHKPELIVALTRFRVLQGFRPLEEISIGERFADLNAMFLAVMAWPAEKIDRIARAADHPIVDELMRTFPGDPGVLAPLFLNAVTLEPGQALFLRERELHSYLDGVGIEIMGNSDNVLRGGLTAKHIDVPELARVLAFEASSPEVINPEEIGGEKSYPAPVEEFALSSVRVDGEWRPATRDGIEILLCVEGSLEGLPRGRAALVTRDNPYSLRGNGRLFRARVP